MTSLKILAVDDSVAILDAIREVLTSTGHIVETADNGAQALDKYNSFKPDMVTLDVAMPVMDGEETLRRLIELDPNARVIMLTACEHKEMIQKCLRNGAIGFLVKPFSGKELINAITNIISIGYEKNINSVFSMACSKIDASVKKLLGNDTSVSLKGTSTVSLHTQNIFVNNNTNYNEQSPSNVLSSTNNNNGRQMEAPVGTVGYISEFKGHNGVVISFINDEDLGRLFGNERVKGMDLDSESLSLALEFFNIINQKVISEIANTTNIKVKPLPTRLYYKSKDKFAFKDNVLIAKWEITTSDDNSIPVETRFGFTG